MRNTGISRNETNGFCCSGKWAVFARPGFARPGKSNGLRPDDAVIELAEYLIGGMQSRGRSKERLQDELGELVAPPLARPSVRVLQSKSLHQRRIFVACGPLE